MKLLILALIFKSTLALAAIYGSNDRRDIYQVPQYRPIAEAVAVAVGHNLLLANGDGTTRVDMVDRFGSHMCSDEKFLGQPSLGFCAGFLIGDRYLVTAGHCVLPTGVTSDPAAPFCQDIDWYFNYSMDIAGLVDDQNIPSDHLYRCKRLIRAENVEHISSDPTSDSGNDFALLELDRPVVASIHPLSLASKPVVQGELVYTIGYPLGLPAKFSGLAPVTGTKALSYFEAGLDTESGNSGGPVLNGANQVVGILVSGHPEDYSTDPKLGCLRFNVCNALGLNCGQNSQWAWLQTDNYIQRIDAVLSYLPK